MTIDQTQFPWAPLDLKYELYCLGAWQDITEYVRSDDGACAEVTHGRQDEATRPDPAKCKFVLNNADGRFSPRNPRSPLFGLIGRNTPFRMSITWGGFTYYRFYGEISQWPPDWEQSGADLWVPIEASGVSRRINRRGAPVTSPIRRLMNAQDQSKIVGYWPMEDPSTATEFGSALTAGYAMKRKSGSSSLASNSDIPGAASLPSLESGYWVGKASDYTPSTKLQVTFVASASSNPASDALCVHWTTTGTAAGWTMVLLGTGLMELRAYSAGVRVLTATLSGAISNAGEQGPVNNPSRWSVELTQSGADVNYNVERYSIDDNDGSHGSSGTLSGYTFGKVKDVRVNDPASALGSVTIGHVLAVNDIIDITSGDFYNADIAYAGEFPSVRALRICDENGIPSHQVSASQSTDSTRMGSQPVASISDILDECRDLGYLIFDDRSAFGFMLMPMEWRYDRNTAVSVDYGKLSGPPKPVDDDQGIVNDIVVTRSGGADARYVVSTGPLSTAEPPDGVGLYPSSATLNLFTDDLVQWWAQWFTHFGTYDDARYPVIPFNLLKDVNQTLIPDIIQELETSFNTGVEVGQVIRVSNLPSWLPGGPIEAVIHGWTERLGPWCWEIDFSCSPAGPWRMWVVEDDGTTYQDDVSRGHVDTSGSVTATATFHAGTDTSLSVTTTSGPRWVTPADQSDAFPFDIMVSGVRLRVTSISGTGSTQTFTVEAATINGVNKDIAAGAAVNIVPVYVGV